MIYVKKNYKNFVFIILCFTALFLESSTSSIPVIFVQSGNLDCLKDALIQAKKFNERVILIGDDSNRYHAYDGIEYYPISEYNKSSNYFSRIYRHMSKVPYEKEFGRFARWFVLEEFTKANNVPIFFYAESDVMLYCDISSEYNTNFNGCDLAVELHHGFCNGLVSYWNTKTISSFCFFLNQFYEDKLQMDILEDQFLLGSEQYHDDWPHMTNWVHENSNTFKIGNLSSLINNTTFDSSVLHDYILVPNAASVLEYKRYRMWNSGLNLRTVEKWMKEIIWHNGIPYCYSEDLGSFIQFKSLHFQGVAKVFIEKYKSSRNDLITPEPYASIKTLPFYMLGFFSHENHRNLEYFIKNYRPKTIVELGSWLGASTAFMAFFMPEDGKVYSVDYFDSKLDSYLNTREDANFSTYPIYQQFLSNMKHYQLCHKVIPIKMSTLDAAFSLNVNADLIYVDACTDEESVYRDIMSWYPKLNRGGIICGNNWKWFESIRRGVNRAAKELERTVKVDENFWYFDLVE